MPLFKVINPISYLLNLCFVDSDLLFLYDGLVRIVVWSLNCCSCLWIETPPKKGFTAQLNIFFLRTFKSKKEKRKRTFKSISVFTKRNLTLSPFSMDVVSSSVACGVCIYVFVPSFRLWYRPSPGLSFNPQRIWVCESLQVWWIHGHATWQMV